MHFAIDKFAITFVHPLHKCFDFDFISKWSEENNIVLNADYNNNNNSNNNKNNNNDNNNT